MENPHVNCEIYIFDGLVEIVGYLCPHIDGCRHLNFIEELYLNIKSMTIQNNFLPTNLFYLGFYENRLLMIVLFKNCCKKTPSPNEN